MRSKFLIFFGMACILFYATVTIQAALYQRKAKAEIDRMISAHATGVAAPAIATTPSIARPLVPGELIGRVDVPRLKLSAVVAEGDDDTTLGKAVGHLPDTPLPWQRRGNVALAAHRDGLFRGLKDIRMDDEIRLVTAHGDYSYRVRRTHIVDPKDVWVVNPTVRPTVTLITCYP